MILCLCDSKRRKKQENAIKKYHTEEELHVSNKSMYRIFFEGVWVPMKWTINLIEIKSNLI